MSRGLAAASAVVAVVVQAAAIANTRQSEGASVASRVIVLDLASAVFGNTRGLRIYLPAGYDAKPERRYPVLYLNDGASVFSPRGWDAPGTLDRLIAASEIPPMILVGIDNAASIPGATAPAADRANEYLPYADSLEPDALKPKGLQYPDFLVNEVMPFVATRFRVQDGAASTGVGGASYGGIAAVVAVIRRPEVFGALLLESTPLFLFDERLTDEARRVAVWPRTVYVGVGGQETPDAAILKRGADALGTFVALAQSRTPSVRVLYNIVADGTHTSSSWRARLPTALRFLYGAIR